MTKATTFICEENASTLARTDISELMQLNTLRQTGMVKSLINFKSTIKNLGVRGDSLKERQIKSGGKIVGTEVVREVQRKDTGAMHFIY